jgi:hypothetical protein
MKVRRDLLKEALENGTLLYQVVDRGVGKTTQAIFRAIADSYVHFGKPVVVQDPDAKIMHEANRRWLANMVLDTLRTNKLEHIRVDVTKEGTVTITNTFAENLTIPY